MPPIVLTDPQIVGHVLYSELAQVIESCFFCFETCLQVFYSVAVIFGGSSANCNGSFLNLNSANVGGLQFIQEGNFKILKIRFCGLKFPMLANKFGGENVEIWHNTVGVWVGGFRIRLSVS